MDIYNSIASWGGWPPIVAILLLMGSFGIWFYQRHITFLKDEIESLSRKLQECQQNFSLDIVAKRLADRHKTLTEEIENLEYDRENSKTRINELEKELCQTREEADALRSQMVDVQEILGDMDLPRDGKIRPDIAEDILKTVNTQSAIYIPITSWGEFDKNAVTSLKKNDPFKIEVDFPGMNQMDLNVLDNNNSSIGEVTNPYQWLYEKGYYVTLLDILSSVPHEDLHGIENPYAEAVLLKTSKFHAVSPIDPSVIYIRIPMRKVVPQTT